MTTTEDTSMLPDVRDNEVLKAEYERLKALFTERDSALDKAQLDGDLSECRRVSMQMTQQLIQISKLLKEHEEQRTEERRAKGQ